MSDPKLGFVEIKASDVIDLTNAVIERIQADKAEWLEKTIAAEMKNVGFFDRLFGKKSYTREEAIQRLRDDEFNFWTWTALQPDYFSPKHEKLNSMFKVATALLENGYKTMDVSIEAANWLYS